MEEVYGKKDKIDAAIQSNKHEMSKIKADRREYLNTYDNAAYASRDYNNLVKHIDWIKRVKEGIRRDKERADRENEPKPFMEPVNPNQKNID